MGKRDGQTGMHAELLGFGVGGDGQLGLRSAGETQFISAPEHIIGAPCGNSGVSVLSVACGERHTVFLAEDGKLWSVGGNDKGQLGRGNTSVGSFTIYPVSSTTSAKFIQISSGRAHSCAVTDDGRLFAWGDNSNGQCALPSEKLHQESPKRIPLNEVIQVACGPDHTVSLLENGRVFVWGLSHDGASVHTPREVTELLGVPVISVHAGGRHWAALSASGEVMMWGKNEYGQLGTGDTNFRPQATVITALSTMRIVDIALGDAHSLFLTLGGRVFVCGSDSFGQLGLGKRESVSMPRVVMDLMGSHVTRIAVGRIHSLAVVDGRVFTFGLNSNGQLGQGNTRNHMTPRPIETLDSVHSVFAGWDQSFVLRTTQNGVPKTIISQGTTRCEVKSGPNVELVRPRVLTWDGQEGMPKDKLDLITKIESVFTSLSCLNGSFLFKDDKRYCMALENPCVNLDDAMEFFNSLAATGDCEQYNELMLDSLEISLFAGEVDPHKFLNAECVRCLLILPWMNSFLAVKAPVVQSLHKRLCQYISSLNKKHMEHMIHWWISIPVRHFKRTVDGFVAALKCSVEIDKRDPGTWELILSTLSLLFQVNYKSEKIPLESFYVDTLADKFDLKMDYAMWANTPPNQLEHGQFFWSAYPFVLNGVAKGELLHIEALLQQQGATLSTNQVIRMFGMSLVLGDPFYSLDVRRDHIIQDTLNSVLSEDPAKLRKQLRVTFRGEEAEDHGGVRKEYFIMLFEKLLHPEYGMFVENEETHLIWFSGVEGDLDSFKMVGMLCGLAVYNDVLVPFPFPLPLYKLILKKPLTLDDLGEFSPTEAKSLRSLLDYDGNDVEDVFMLNFTITHSIFDQPYTVPLKDGGADIPVTSSNRSEYVNLYVKAKMELGMDGQVEKQIGAFCEGFHSIVTSRIISRFQPRELQELVEGNETFDWSKFRKRVQYKGVYHALHPAIIAFWEAFFELTTEEKKDFLQFLTGSTRLPARGMDGLDAHIQPCASHLLPVAHTCFNLLDLPDVHEKTEMLRRLRISISQPRGFSLV